MILDTSFVIDFLKGESNAVSKMKSLLEEGMVVAITTPTIFELYSGLIFLNKSEKEEDKIISLLKKQIVFPLDSNSAERAGRIDGFLMKAGLKIETNDSMIAGIAKINNETILTRDVKHFSRISGLKVESY